MKRLLSTLFLSILVTTSAAAQNSWKAEEIFRHYDLPGTTAPQLYESIGKRGPEIGKTRVIAQTKYVLTWDRKFDRSNNACTVVSATPKLKITYTLPKPTQKLPSPLRESWERFYDGIRVHELVHGDHAKEITREIVRKTVGLSVPNDPKCQKIRKVLAKEINDMVRVQQKWGRDFDRDEMSNGGNVHRLILTFLNENR